MEPGSDTIPAPRARLSAQGTTATAGDLELQVSDVSNLPAKGATLTVEGHGYDSSKGIYVAFCKEPKPNRTPSPCGGGAATEGSTGASQWISSNPPPYGRGLSIPYEEGGSFTTTLHVQANLDTNLNCRKVQCVVVTRNDHTRSSDRSQDVFVPVTFTGSQLAASDGGSSGSGAAVPIAIGAVVVIAAVVAGIVLFRKRRGRAPVATDAPTTPAP